jgi:hypothetical protein
MSVRKKQHKYFNQVPKFCVIDEEDGSCAIYELKDEIRDMHSIEALFMSCVIVRYDGVDAIIEDATSKKSFFMELRSGSVLPETYDGADITWYEHEDDPDAEITLDDIITMCAI